MATMRMQNVGLLLAAESEIDAVTPACHAADTEAAATVTFLKAPDGDVRYCTMRCAGPVELT